MQIYHVLSTIFVLTESLRAEQNASFNSTTRLSVSVQTPSTMGYSKQENYCVCTYYQLGRYLRAEVNGRDMIYGISLRRGRTAVLSCRNSSMNLFWPNGAFTAKSANLTCIECGEWKVGDIPSCQASRLVEEASFNSTTRSSVSVQTPNTIRYSKHENYCVCTYYQLGRYLRAEVNGRDMIYGISLRRGRTAVLSCRNSSMNLFWPNGAFTAKSANLTCIECGEWKVGDIPSCQVSRTEGIAYNPTTSQTTFPVDGPAPEDECSCEYTLNDLHIIAHSDGKLVKLHDRVKNGSILTFRCSKIGYYQFVGVKEIQCKNCQFQNISEPPSCTRPKRGDAMIFLDKNVNVSLEGVLQVQKLKPLRLVCSVMKTAEFPIWDVPNVAGINLTEETVENSKDAHHFLSHLEIDKIMPGDSGAYTCALDKDNGRPAVVQVEVIAPPCSSASLSQVIPHIVVYDKDDVTNSTMPYNSTVKLKCRGFKYLEEDSFARCGSEGIWEVGNITCISGCSGFIQTPESRLLIQPGKDVYRIGEFVALSCKSGYKPSPDLQIVTCLQSGWSEDALPECVKWDDSD